MKLSTKGRYGARAALELALRYGQGLVLVREIAASQDISVRYLEHILNSLRTSGLLKSYRGAKGGYELARHPSKITLGEIIRSLEGPLNIVPCCEENGCKKIPDCAMAFIWGDVKGAIDNVLDSITLEDIKQKSQKMKKQSDNYAI